MSVTIGAAIATMNVAKSVAAYTGLIESTSEGVDKLVHQAFKSARMLLEMAKTASSREQSLEYLKEARNKFVDAISVEKDESLVLAYAGLAMCQFLLGDRQNARLTLAKIPGVKLSNAEKMKAGAKGYLEGLPIPSPPIKIMIAYKAAKKRGKEFQKFKDKVMSEMQ